MALTASQMQHRLMEQISGNKKNKKVKSNFAKLYKESFAIDSVNKYDTSFSLNSVELKEILKRNDFQDTISKLGYDLSLYGSGYGLIIYRYNGESIIDKVRIYDAIYTIKKLTEVWFYTESKFSTEKESFDILGHFWIENGVVMKETGYTDSKGVWNAIDEAIVYDTKMIPVLPMLNNVFGQPDILTSADNLLKQLETMVDKIPTEVELAKQIFAFNEYTNSTQGASEFQRDVVENEGNTFSTSDPDNIIANSVSSLGANSNSVDMLERVAGWYDGRIRELSFQFRDHGSDSRKNEYDLVIYNQKAFEYMTNKLLFRNRQLQKFIDMLATIENIPLATIKITMVEFEQQRIDNLKAIVDTKVAMSEQARAIADKNKAEAESLKNGALKATDPIATVTNLTKEGE